ncbi:MAG: transposase [Acidobacteriota bacterium]
MLQATIMPRRRRLGMAGLVYHVMNRGARRGTLFESTADYDSFVAVLREAVERRPIRLLSFCVMPNHFHLLLWPQTDAQLPDFMHWLTSTHGLRWRTANHTRGEGAVYQGRYKAIPVQTEAYFLRAARYVERNALRARLVSKAEAWRWSSLWHREAHDGFPLAEWPLRPPPDWLDLVNQPQELTELAVIRRSVHRGCALGNVGWQEETAKRLGIRRFYSSPGRPRATGVNAG